MMFHVVSISPEGLATELRRSAARLEAIAADRAAAARAAAVGWEGASRERFNGERTRQSALAAHLAAQGHRLASELDAG
jgi:uncharacterized protein YukE